MSSCLFGACACLLPRLLPVFRWFGCWGMGGLPTFPCVKPALCNEGTLSEVLIGCESILAGVPGIFGGAAYCILR